MNIQSTLENITEIQHHRGPDGRGIWLNATVTVGLCHNRLAILDLSAAATQPMRSCDGRYIITYNGEIYNYQELKELLISQGSRFQSESDTEVLLEAYRAWGEGMLLRLRGMFAFAIYDVVSNMLFCARDRVGKKPFVYSATKQGFAFASEIPALKIITQVDLSVDRSALGAMLLHNLRHVPDPYTAYVGIQRLRAGHAMIVKDGMVVRMWRYWDPTPSDDIITPERLRSILEDAVRLRMRADVPVGALLSGGVDSSAIVGLMKKFSNKPIHTYALGFDGQDEDLRRARIMAESLGTIHHEFYFNPEEQWDIFNRLIRIYGEPIMLLPLVHTYALCRAIREDGIKVVLTGNGADELFYGYTGHIRTLKVSNLLDKLAFARPIFKPLINTRLGWLAAKSGERKAAYYRAIAGSEWGVCLSKDAQFDLANRAAEEMCYWGSLCPSDHYIDESNFVGLMVENPHSVTISGDLPAMAASVEIRAPFLDQEIISFALATPARKKIPDTNNPAWLKAILRDAVQDLMPEALLKAPKRGFGMGIQEADVLRGPWRSRAAELFENPNDAGGMFDTGAVSKVWRDFSAGHGSASRVAKILSFQAWLN